MYASTFVYGLVALTGVMASPVEGPEIAPRAVEPRTPGIGDFPVPKFAVPTRNKGNNKMGGGGSGCSASSQSNACSGGSPYCCSSDGKGGNVCSNTTACNQQIICCNNQNGFQICIGDVDFNMPITINVYE